MFQSKLSKLSLTVAGSAIAAVTAMGPASAANAVEPPQPVPNRSSVEAPTTDKGGGGHHYYRGKVITKKPLLVHKKPSTHSKVVGKLRPGANVAIACKTKGKPVYGNPYWYKLAHGGYVTANPHFVKIIGKHPHKCRSHHG